MSKPSPLDPVLRERLLKEARTPWRSLRRALWFTLFASALLPIKWLLNAAH